MMSLVSHDVVEDLSGIGLVEGAGAEREFLTGLLGSFPDLTTDVSRVVASGDVVAVEWRRTGTLSGSSWRGLPADGQPFVLRGGAFLEVRANKITRINGYYDTAGFARQIGALPREGSRGDRLAMAIFRTRVRIRRTLTRRPRGGSPFRAQRGHQDTRTVRHTRERPHA
jgi:steroid delta-isomerase-like uncharacterized protein